ncbi:MAG: carbohydrate porin [Bryobacteraceae bacterium]
MKFPRLVLRLIGPALLSSLCLGADPSVQTEIRQLRQDMEQLRQDYEQRMQKMEERLKQLESSSAEATAQPAPTAPAAAPVGAAGQTAPAPAPAGPTAQQSRQEYADELFRSTTESRDQALEDEKSQAIRKRVEQVLQGFLDISGYFRAGYGRDSEGGPQTGFIAPGAMAKGRLGNEGENYGELIFSKDLFLPGAFSLDPTPRSDDIPSGPIAHFQVRLSMFNPYQNYMASTATSFGLAESWASIGNLSASQPGMKFWAGNRFYRRHDIHIDDFFFYNMSGGGGGVEDIKTGLGKVALAWIGLGSQSAFSDVPQPDPTNRAGFSKTNWILSLYDTPLPGGKGEFGLTYTRATSGRDANGATAPNTSGAAFTFIHTSNHFADQNGINTFSIQYGTDAAKTFTSGFETYTTDAGTFIRPDAPGSYRFRATENVILQPSPHFSFSPVVLYQLTDYKQYGGIERWFSAGVRPVVHFNNFVSLALEPFVDWTEDENTHQSGYLTKLTLAPQISLGNAFMSRPAIRGFFTYARWAEGFVGQIGGFDFANRNRGFTTGVQMETWW